MDAAELTPYLAHNYGWWHIVHRVRDGGYAEDQGHGRKIGQALAWARNVALSLIRHYGMRSIPDGWRLGSAQPQLRLQWLIQGQN